MGGLLTIPIGNSIEDLLDQLEKVVLKYEEFNKTLSTNPSVLQHIQNRKLVSEFKGLYNQIVIYQAQNSRAEDLLSRFKKVENRFESLIIPQSYNYETHLSDLAAPLLRK